VARVAQAHEVNPNLLFLWRRQHREGRLLASEADRLRLLPVTVVDSSSVMKAKWKSQSEAAMLTSSCPEGGCESKAVWTQPRCVRSRGSCRGDRSAWARAHCPIWRLSIQQH
jgi:hypothetical protein